MAASIATIQLIERSAKTATTFPGRTRHKIIAATLSIQPESSEQVSVMSARWIAALEECWFAAIRNRSLIVFAASQFLLANNPKLPVASKLCCIQRGNLRSRHFCTVTQLHKITERRLLQTAPTFSISAGRKLSVLQKILILLSGLTTRLRGVATVFRKYGSRNYLTALNPFADSLSQTVTVVENDRILEGRCELWKLDRY